MGMSTYIQGIKLPDEKWKKMKAVYDACAVAGLPIPEEVDSYFEGEKPHPDGVKVSLRSYDAVSYLEPGHPESGYRVDVRKLPKDIALILFENSW